MSIDWTKEERVDVAQAIAEHPIGSGRCAALARVVFKTGAARDPNTKGRQVRPPRTSAARYVVPKVPHPPQWCSHTLVDTHAHSVDALTGPDGCEKASYLEQYWEYPEYLEVIDVDVFGIDRGIEGET
jgi:hypothetical protein